MTEDMSKKDVGCMSVVKDIVDSTLSDIISYINEYGNVYNLLAVSKEVATANREAIVNCVKQHDVVVYAKTGCGFCERAKQLLYTTQTEFQQEHSGRYAFSINVAMGTDSEVKSALGELIDLNDVTFPQIMVKGVYIGGSDNLNKWMESGAFKQMLESDNSLPMDATSIPWYPPLATEAATPNLFYVPMIKGTWYPSNWPWYTFQWCMFGNLVRYISVLQIAAMVPVCILLSTSYSDSSTNVLIAKILLYALLTDLCILVFHGPTPFSPSGALSTYFGWRVRGNATSSVPYKVVFLAYIIGILPQLLGNYSSETARYKSISRSMVGLITNSAILVAFRF